MGRSQRKDVDYFPFYIKEGRTLFVLESKYRCKGTGFFTNLMRFLARTPDHHFQMKTKSDKLYFFASVKCDEEPGMDMIKMMVETEKLDPVLWAEEMVLASQDFLESIQDAYRKRKTACITISEIRALYGITTGRKEITAGENTGKREKCGSYPQSKLKETKGKKTKRENTVENEIYNLYISEIKPSQKSKKRTIANLKKHLKNHTPETLKQSILNYKILAVKKEPNYRKDPANFFGSAEKDQFFADYLPENFEAPETQPTTAPHYHKIMDARAIEEANA